ncbi:hypothetical protein WMF11_10545 [Sorangium sp. So ce295]|uniref:hypothetical protein n=1 Tax=Sorangium sp. So ce295 TaxID=3133295 RepID=UPI003F634697
MSDEKLPPHPATVRVSRPAHPATVQRKAAPFWMPRAPPPHPATLPRVVVQPKAIQQGPPHTATVQRTAARAPASDTKDVPDVKAPAAASDVTQALLKMLKNAYQMKTFKRQGFTKDQRLDAWLAEAKKDAEALKADFDKKAAQEAITSMSETLAVKGMHLRHVIPYSDIAGVFYIATSDASFKLLGEDKYRELRQLVTTLVDLLGEKEDQATWRGLVSATGLLTKSATRSAVRVLCRRIANAKKNLFEGSGTVNMAIQNRLDPSVYAAALESSHLESLCKWWFDCFTLLGMNPRLEKARIYSITKKTYIDTEVYSHEGSRPLGTVYEPDEELEWFDFDLKEFDA